MTTDRERLRKIWNICDAYGNSLDARAEDVIEEIWAVVEYLNQTAIVC